VGVLWVFCGCFVVLNVKMGVLFVKILGIRQKMKNIICSYRMNVYLSLNFTTMTNQTNSNSSAASATPSASALPMRIRPEEIQTERPPVLTYFQKNAAIQAVVDFLGANDGDAFFSTHQIDENRIMIFGHGGNDKFFPNEEDWTPVYTLTDMSMEQALSIINTACGE